jgi:serine/threonine protein kinase/Leucine-rich repeat (LRR) protein
MKSSVFGKFKLAPFERGSRTKPAAQSSASGISELLRKAAASDGSAFRVTDATLTEKVDVVEAAVPGGNIARKDVAPRDGRHYTIGSPVAQGGMGTILHARDLNLRRTVAMKVILPDKHDHEQYHLRFLQEAQLTAQLEHPNIVPVHELGADEQGKPFYTMKFVQGITLREVLEKIKAGDSEAIAVFSLAHLLTIFQKVCDAGAFAHSRGVVHRDLKPENIMLGEYGEVLVMDWGLAKVVNSANVQHPTPTSSGDPVAAVYDRREENQESGTADGGHRPPLQSPELTVVGQILGTPNFMSPEQAEGKVDEIDARTDIFALGGILYNILTLHPPVSGKSVQEIVQKIRTGDIRPPASFNAKSGSGILPDGSAKRDRLEACPGLSHCPGGRIPQSLSAVCMKALALRPEDRYQTVPELQRDIEAYQGGFATVAEQAGTFKLLWLLIKRHKALFLVSHTALLVLVVAGIAFTVRIAASERRARTTLVELQATAPEFHAQALALTTEGKFEEALKKISYALQLRPDLPEYHVLQGNLYQSLVRLTEAGAAYERAVQLDPAQAVASENLELCEKLLASHPDPTKLSVSALTELYRAMRHQERFVEARAILPRLGREVVADAAGGILRNTGVKAGVQVDAVGLLSIDLSNTAIADLSPLQGLPIKELKLNKTRVRDLEPLRGMPLRLLWIHATDISDLTPLKGMPLAELYLGGEVRDLGPLQGMRLQKLVLNGGRRQVNDLTPLRGMPLTWLEIRNSPITDLSPLRGMPLRTLSLWQVPQVTDLSPLAGMQLTSLVVEQSRVRDISPLKGMHLTDLGLIGAPLSDLTPLEGMRLNWLVLHGTQVADLRPLQGNNFEGGLDLGNTQVTDLSPLSGAVLEALSLYNTPVRDLSPLKSVRRLKYLILEGCQNVTDLTPLAGCSELRCLILSADSRDIEFLRQLPNLERLGYTKPHNAADDLRWAWNEVSPPAKFWKDYDAKKQREDRR